jgi:hypothetical protein
LKFIKYIKNNYWRFTPDSWVDWIYYFISSLKDKWDNFVFWKLSGFPFKKRCPFCAGDGTESTETMDRYGDNPYTCSFCKGAGFVKRF